MTGRTPFPLKKVLLMSVPDPVKRDLFKENLKSNAIDFEIRNVTDIFVREDEIVLAQAVIQEGQWEY